MSPQVSIALHEVSHVFQEGGDLLVSLGVLSQATLAAVRIYSAAFDHIEPHAQLESDPETLGLYQSAYKFYTMGEICGVGLALGQLAIRLTDL